MVVLEEDLGASDGASVHLQPQQKHAAVVRRGSDPLVKVERQEAIAARERSTPNALTNMFSHTLFLLNFLLRTK